VPVRPLFLAQVVRQASVYPTRSKCTAYVHIEACTQLEVAQLTYRQDEVFREVHEKGIGARVCRYDTGA
jgi:hypothetical protein